MIVLYQPEEMPKQELHGLATASRLCGFPFVDCPSLVRSVDPHDHDVLVGRYRGWPYGGDLERVARYSNHIMINNPESIRWGEDLSAWTRDLAAWTVPAYSPEGCPEGGPFVCKGGWKSRKDSWSTLMFAPNRGAARAICYRLQEDTLIGQGPVWIRPFRQLRTILTGINDLPVAEEFRLFVLDGKVLTTAFYWASYQEDVEDVLDGPVPVFNTDPSWLNPLLEAVKAKIRFCTIDIAIQQDGRPILIDLNDGQRSGLGLADPFVLYDGIFRGLSD